MHPLWAEFVEKVFGWSHTVIRERPLARAGLLIWGDQEFILLNNFVRNTILPVGHNGNKILSRYLMYAIG
jgi:hypothetical protein